MALPPKSEGAESRWGGPRVALAAILAGAAALRIVGTQYGLPFPLLDPGEQAIVPRAWRMVHGGGLDPHYFGFPTLVMELQAPFQAWHSAPSYLTARAVAIAIGLASVAAAWWLGRNGYGHVGGAVAAAVVAVDTSHVAWSRTAMTDVALTLGIAAALALLAAGRLEWAGLAAGLAASARYPGVLLLVPLLVVGWRDRRRLALAGALFVVGFLGGSPFLAVHPGEAAGDVWRALRLAHEGALGLEHDHAAPIAVVDRLWEGMGPVLFLAAAGLAIALVRRTRADLALASFVLAWLVVLLAFQAHVDRYVLPLVPPLGALAGRQRALAPVALLLLVVPFTWTIRDDRVLTRTDTRLPAREWIEAHLPRGATVAVDPLLPRLEGFRTLSLALPGPGRTSDPNRDLARLRAEGVRYAVVTGAVADPVLAARDRYPREARFYETLRARALRLHYQGPGPGLAGPWVAVYRLYS